MGQCMSSALVDEGERYQPQSNWGQDNRVGKPYRPYVQAGAAQAGPGYSTTANVGLARKDARNPVPTGTGTAGKPLSGEAPRSPSKRKVDGFGPSKEGGAFEPALPKPPAGFTIPPLAKIHGAAAAAASPTATATIRAPGGSGLAPAGIPSERAPLNWRRGELLGQGAFGSVYLGLDDDTGELMAVKQVSLRPSGSSGPAQGGKVANHIKALEAEVTLLRRLNHPNIVRYLGTERTRDALHIFLEYVPGGSLMGLVRRFGSLPETVVRVYTRQILLGLAYLHANGIMHRDIKGANILVDNSGLVKLADFGASKSIEDLLTLESGFKSVRGTPYWMAPEVIKQSGYGRQADIWSVACTVIEMATGKPPWSQYESQVSAMFHIASSKGPPPIPQHLSAECKDFLYLCFNRNWKDRPQATALLQHPFLAAVADRVAPVSAAAPPPAITGPALPPIPGALEASAIPAWRGPGGAGAPPVSAAPAAAEAATAAAQHHPVISPGEVEGTGLAALSGRQAGLGPALLSPVHEDDEGLTPEPSGERASSGGEDIEPRGDSEGDGLGSGGSTAEGRPAPSAPPRGGSESGVRPPQPVPEPGARAPHAGPSSHANGAGPLQRAVRSRSEAVLAVAPGPPRRAPDADGDASNRSPTPRRRAHSRSSSANSAGSSPAARMHGGPGADSAGAPPRDPPSPRDPPTSRAGAGSGRDSPSARLASQGPPSPSRVSPHRPPSSPPRRPPPPSRGGGAPPKLAAPVAQAGPKPPPPIRPRPAPANSLRASMPLLPGQLWRGDGPALGSRARSGPVAGVRSRVGRPSALDLDDVERRSGTVDSLGADSEEEGPAASWVAHAVTPSALDAARLATLASSLASEHAGHEVGSAAGDEPDSEDDDFNPVEEPRWTDGWTRDVAGSASVDAPSPVDEVGGGSGRSTARGESAREHLVWTDEDGGIDALPWDVPGNSTSST